jgi:hypothetical protein
VAFLAVCVAFADPARAGSLIALHKEHGGDADQPDNKQRRQAARQNHEHPIRGFPTFLFRFADHRLVFHGHRNPPRGASTLEARDRSPPMMVIFYRKSSKFT